MGCGSDGVHDDASGDCADVLADVWRFLDNELDPERRAAIRRHLDNCSPCLEEAGLDTKLKALLARKCGGEQAPAQLRQRIVTQLVSWRTDDGAASIRTTTVTVTEDGGSAPLPGGRASDHG